MKQLSRFVASVRKLTKKQIGFLIIGIWFVASVVLTLCSPKPLVGPAVGWAELKILMALIAVICTVIGLAGGGYLIATIGTLIIICCLDVALAVLFPVPLLAWLFFRVNIFSRLWGIVSWSYKKVGMVEETFADVLILIAVIFFVLISILGWMAVATLWNL